MKIDKLSDEMKQVEMRSEKRETRSEREKTEARGRRIRKRKDKKETM
jgi:hypothetical protein